MKKIFYLTIKDKTPERQLDSIRHDIKKYIARERRKPKPVDGDFWGFNCKIGETPESAQKTHMGEIFSEINKFASLGKESFYIEILAKSENKPIKKTPKKIDA